MWAAQKDISYAFKICIVGAGGVGKTCLFNRFCFNSYNVNTEMTIGISFHSTYLRIHLNNEQNYNQEKFVLNSIFDMSGQERFRPLIQKFIEGSNGALLVFDPLSFSTFQQLEFWYNQVIENSTQKTIPIILVASKSDLLSKTPKSQIVDEDLIVDFIKNKKLQGYYKTSALENRNILEVFKELTNLMLKSSNCPAIVI
jgi:small GTP-binding protein